MYLRDVVGGTFSLIAEGISRHQEEKQQQWIDVIERLTGLSLSQVPLSKIRDFSAYELGINKRPIYIQSDLTLKTAQIALPYDKNNQQLILLNIQDINQTISRISALLILNELGRHPKNLRNQALKRINTLFGFDIKMIPSNSVLLDKAQKRQLARGEVVMSLSNTTSGTPSINVYANVGNSGLILHLGPIPTFQWHPLSLILPLIALATILLLIGSYVLIHSLEKKLKTLENGIKQAGTKNALPIQLVGDDHFSNMALSINDMMQRINSLLTQQKQLTHDISHELRTPIARILFRLESLQNKHFKEPNNNISGMRTDLQVLNKMIEEILTDASLDNCNHLSAGSHNTMQSFDLSLSIKDLISNLSTQYSSIQFMTDFSSAPKEVLAHQTHLLRAIENVVLNACKHCKSCISITLSTHQHSYWILKIDDDGQGIETQHREKVFQPFVRLDSSRAKSRGGFGLGLSIVHKTISLHSGEITIDESEELQGASFKMKVPIFAN